MRLANGEIRLLWWYRWQVMCVVDVEFWVDLGCGLVDEGGEGQVIEK